MQSKADGKKEVAEWVRINFDWSTTILDVGAGFYGTYRRLLKEYPNMDAVEVFAPSAEKINDMYNTVYVEDIKDFNWDGKDYDLIIFGDVIEHLSIEDAQRVLELAKEHCKDLIVAVPFMYPQEAVNGNKYEEHLQGDLTLENMKERYPMLEVLVHPVSDYCYYHLNPEY